MGFRDSGYTDEGIGILGSEGDMSSIQKLWIGSRHALLGSSLVGLLACYQADAGDKALLTFDPLQAGGTGGTAGTTGAATGNASGAAGTATGNASGSNASGNAPTGGSAGTSGNGLTGTNGGSANTSGGSGNLGTSGAVGVTGEVFPFAANCRTPWEEPGNYHDPGYDAPEVHGPEAILFKDSCLDCHGEDLTGCTKADSCDNCHDGGHADGWREDCVYCHGGDENDTGAPPHDLDPFKSGPLSFPSHSAHVMEGDLHDGHDCDSCHKKPESMLDSGHMFDDTLGEAEVSFAGGLAKEGAYDKNTGDCSSIYCHGDGREPGKAPAADSELDCNSCHADHTRPTALSGAHNAHMNPTLNRDVVIGCDDCHGDTVRGDDAIVGKAFHVNGEVDFKPPADTDIRRTGTQCSGTCHNFNHAGIFTLFVPHDWFE